MKILNILSIFNKHFFQYFSEFYLKCICFCFFCGCFFYSECQKLYFLKLRFLEWKMKLRDWKGQDLSVIRIDSCNCHNPDDKSKFHCKMIRQRVKSWVSILPAAGESCPSCLDTGVGRHGGESGASTPDRACAEAWFGIRGRSPMAGLSLWKLSHPIRQN